MRDVLRPYVPEYKGQVTSDDGECKYFKEFSFLSFVLSFFLPFILAKDRF